MGYTFTIVKSYAFDIANDVVYRFGELKSFNCGKLVTRALGLALCEKNDKAKLPRQVGEKKTQPSYSRAGAIIFKD